MTVAMCPMRWVASWLVVLLWVAFCMRNGSAQLQESMAIYGGTCTKTCGSYELCFVYENADYCAPYCAPGRCDDTKEICILEGKPCQKAPCIPQAICEPKAAELNPSTSTSTTGTTTTTTSTCSRTCPSVSSPVCGSNGVSYVNKCYLEEAQCADSSIALDSLGLCADTLTMNQQYEQVTSTTSASAPSSSPCNSIICAPVYIPVCGSDGQTYQNSCFLSKASCLDSRVWMAQPGACPTATSTGTGTGTASSSGTSGTSTNGGLSPACATSCTDEYTGICGSNGILYGNKCLFQKAVCEREARGLELIEAEPQFCMT